MSKNSSSRRSPWSLIMYLGLTFSGAHVPRRRGCFLPTPQHFSRRFPFQHCLVAYDVGEHSWKLHSRRSFHKYMPDTHTHKSLAALGERSIMHITQVTETPVYLHITRKAITFCNDVCLQRRLLWIFPKYVKVLKGVVHWKMNILVIIYFLLQKNIFKNIQQMSYDDLGLNISFPKKPNHNQHWSNRLHSLKTIGIHLYFIHGQLLVKWHTVHD